MQGIAALPDINDLMKKIDKTRVGLWETLSKKEIVGEAGGGLVKITVLGDGTFTKCEILTPMVTKDKDFVEDLIISAVNNAINKALEEKSEVERGLAAAIGDLTKEALVKAVEDNQSKTPNISLKQVKEPIN